MATFLNNMPSLTKRKKSPEQLISSAKEVLSIIIAKAKSHQINQVADDISDITLKESAIPPLKADPKHLELKNAEHMLKKRLHYLKVVLYGDVNEHFSTSTTSSIGSDIDESKILELSRQIQQSGLMLDLIAHMDLIPFEARKDTALVFNNLVRKDTNNFVEYCFLHRSFLIPCIIHGYDRPETALNCGSMARELIRYENLQRCILYPIEDIKKSDIASGGLDAGKKKARALVWDFFDKYIHLPNFDVASDAFNTLRELLVATR
jgi:hypothetical protein